MLLFGRAPERDHGRMLDEQQHILRDFSGNSLPSHLALVLEGLGVGHETQALNA
jgi:hypothetical protein